MKHIKDLTQKEKKDILEKLEIEFKDTKKLETITSWLREFMKFDEEVIRKLQKQIPSAMSREEEKIIVYYIKYCFFDYNWEDVDEAINLFKKLVK